MLKNSVKYIVDTVAIDESNRLILHRSHEIILIEEVNRQLSMCHIGIKK